MEFFGSYHYDPQPHAELPSIRRGRMCMAAWRPYTEDPHTLAFVCGRIRGKRKLAQQLGCSADADEAALLSAAYAEWGEDFPKHIEGSAVLCVMDMEKDALILARDRMGQRSLFFSVCGEAVVFADHPEPILRSGIVEPLMDRDGVCELFGLGPAGTPGKTPIKGLNSLLPGEMLTAVGGKIERRRYYTLTTCPHDDPPGEAAVKVRGLLEQSINDIVDLHPASMLSGGLDSTALTALLCSRIRRVDSFSVDYRDNARDFTADAFRPEMDAPYIRLAARTLNTHHHCIVLDQDRLAETLHEAAMLRGFPGMADIDSSLLLFAGEISKYAGIVLSGECGDEVFGGYPWFRGEVKLPDREFPWSGSMPLRRSVLKKEIADKADIEGYTADALHASLDSYDIEGGDERTLFAIQRLCFDYFMPNLQERALKMCAGRELEVITPLCDERLVEYVYNTPWRIKKLNGVEKGLYREAVRDLLPEKLRMRKKSPYPKTCSPAYAQIVCRMTAEMLADENAPLWQIADRSRVEALAASALDPAALPWYGQLMAGAQLLAYLLQVNGWMKAYGIRVEL